MNNVVKEIKLRIPEKIEEQITISDVLSDMNTEIELLERKLSKYKMLKQGMMQALLTGRIRLV
jgi:type I restriction enzyme S subunit